MRSSISALSISLMLVAGLPVGIPVTMAFAQESASTAAQVDRIVETFESAWWGERPDTEELKTIATEAMKDLDLKALRGVDLGRLMTFTQMLAHAQKIPDVREALERFLDDKGADGATAQIHLLSSRLWAAREDEEQAKVLRAALTHPGLDAAMEAGSLHNLFVRFRGARPEVMQMCADEVFGLARFLTPAHAPQLAFGYQEYYQMLKSAGGEPRAADVETLRSKMAALAREAAGTFTSQRAVQAANDAAAYLDGPFVRGTLIDHPAPPMTVIWSSDSSIESLASLEGRVVVVDFWATWCGPCIASFPQVRELIEHYEGYPVTVLGVTSPQGFHIPAPRERIHTGSDREKEFSLMAEYLPGAGISWPVIFTEENVFNPAYGVRGIPHVAIIDPAGNVRHNGLHPSLPQGRSLYEKSQKINALLTEAGLPSPPTLPDPADEAPSEAAASPDR